VLPNHLQRPSQRNSQQKLRMSFLSTRSTAHWFINVFDTFRVSVSDEGGAVMNLRCACDSRYLELNYVGYDVRRFSDRGEKSGLRSRALSLKREHDVPGRT
jgi:hypothetical protein